MSRIGTFAPFELSGMPPWQLPSGGLPSGLINLEGGGVGSGQPLSGVIGPFASTSSSIQSGTYTTTHYCCKCHKPMGNYTTGDQVVVQGVSGLFERWCWQCAGYNYQQGGFETREDWIRDSISY